MATGAHCYESGITITYIAGAMGMRTGPKKTDSMRRHERVEQMMQTQLQRIHEAFKADYLTHPGDYLPELIYLHELLAQAQRIYPSQGVVGKTHPQLSAMQSRIAGVYPVLGREAIHLLRDGVSLSLQQRQRISEVMEQASGAGQHKGRTSLFRSLQRGYNERLDDCCLARVRQILQILPRTNSDGRDYEALREFTNSYHAALQRVFREPSEAEALLAQLGALATRFS